MCKIIGLTSAEGQKLERFNWTANNIFKYYDNQVNPLYIWVMQVFYLTRISLCLCVYYNLYGLDSTRVEFIMVLPPPPKGCCQDLP
jgi:hypothetical protein